jgi:type II secretory pathway predicted ATPase ExeA
MAHRRDHHRSRDRRGRRRQTIAARAAVATLDTSRFSVVYLSNPTVGARGIHHHLVTALGDIPKFHRPALIAQTQDLLAAQTEERRKTVVLIVDESSARAAITEVTAD